MTTPPPAPKAISAAFPAPPPFYKSFTASNIALAETLHDADDHHHHNHHHQHHHQHHQHHHHQEEYDSLATSQQTSLRHLRPPVLPPPGSTYRLFGATHSLHPTSSISAPPPVPLNPSSSSSSSSATSTSTPPPPPSISTQPPPPPSISTQPPPPPSISTQPPRPPIPTQANLLSHLHQILLHFLQFTSALASQPQEYGVVWDELRAAFEGMHALVNAYRPHQARESLIAEMEGWVGRGREEVRRMREAGERARAVLDRVGAGAGAGGGNGRIGVSQRDGGKTTGRGGGGGDVLWRGKGVVREERRVERRVWEALHRLERE